jgi:hypothetical protein
MAIRSLSRPVEVILAVGLLVLIVATLAWGLFGRHDSSSRSPVGLAGTTSPEPSSDLSPTPTDPSSPAPAASAVSSPLVAGPYELTSADGGKRLVVAHGSKLDLVLTPPPGMPPHYSRPIYSSDDSVLGPGSSTLEQGDTQERGTFIAKTAGVAYLYATYRVENCGNPCGGAAAMGWSIEVTVQ